MRGVTKELMGGFVLLIAAFLILTHSTGFSRGVGAIGSNLALVSKTLQGR